MYLLYTVFDMREEVAGEIQSSLISYRLWCVANDSKKAGPCSHYDEHNTNK